MSLGQFCIVKLVSSAVLNVVIFGACFDNIGRSRGLAFKMINVFIIKINVFDGGISIGVFHIIHDVRKILILLFQIYFNQQHRKEAIPTVAVQTTKEI